MTQVTIQELENLSNAALDFYIKGEPMPQALQERPLMKALMGVQKTFSGGKGDIRGNVKGDYTTSFIGYSDSDTVVYQRPANIKQFVVPWRELHAGIEITFTDLKKDGINVVDSIAGERTSDMKGRIEHAISNLFEDKLDDMSEGSARSFNEIMWQDGTQSAKVPAGVLSIVTDNPDSGVVEGIDGAQNTWWRNRSFVGSDKVTASVSNQTLTKKLRIEVRQLRRYGGKPNIILAGSGFIEQLEAEVAEKGTYTQEGFMKSGSTEIGLADITMRGVGAVTYDPTLDDLNLENRAYFLDTRHIKPYVMEGENMVRHSPARPAEKYVIYRGITWTGALVCQKRNAHMVIEVA